METEFERITHACEAFALSIQEERYYDAHEDLEAIWFPHRFEDNDEVKLWKGFINAAVCFELIRKGRPEASETAWKTYQKYQVLLENIVTPHKELYVRIVQLLENTRSITCQNS
ncbi:MAG: DUF309 domain-containing protein [Sulfuricurvum sp.]|nr:DUF309 domain-containing protein [Sulfuricurvum sp.]MDD5386862.1 DUF309 domain-containing protein [Sulfuricurvum sp.]